MYIPLLPADLNDLLHMLEAAVASIITDTKGKVLGRTRLSSRCVLCDEGCSH